MIIKKFKAETEKDAILLAKEELGGNAVVMNIKTTTPTGFFKFLRKPYVEVTAAIDENIEYKPKTEQTPEKIQEKPAIKPQVNEVSAIEKKLNDLQGLLEKQLSDSKIKEMRDTSKVITNTEKQSEVAGDFSESFETEKNHKEDDAQAERRKTG